MYCWADGVQLKLWDSWPEGDSEGSNSEVTREDGFYLYPVGTVSDAPHHWHRIRCTPEPAEADTEFMLRICQPNTRDVK